MSTEIYPTEHLVQNLQARNVTWAEVVEICNNPEVTYGPDYRGRKTVQRGDLCVVVGRDGGVITVLLRDAENWTNDQARDRKEKKPR